MDINLDEIRGPLAGFLAAAMIFASTGTAVAAQDNTASSASAVRTIIQTEINAAGAGGSSASETSRQELDDADDSDGMSGNSKI